MAIRTLTIDTKGKKKISGDIEVSNGKCANFWTSDYGLNAGQHFQIDLLKPGTTSTLKINDTTFNIKLSNKIPNISLDNDNGYEYFYIIEPSNPKSNSVLYLYGEEACDHFKCKKEWNDVTWDDETDNDVAFDKLIAPYKTIYIIGTWPALTGSSYIYLPSGDYKTLTSTNNNTYSNNRYNCSPRGTGDIGRIGTSFGCGMANLNDGHTIDTLSSLNFTELTNRGTINTVKFLKNHRVNIINNGVINNVEFGSFRGSGTGGIIKNITDYTSTFSYTNSIEFGSCNDYTINTLSGHIYLNWCSPITIDTVTNTGTITSGFSNSIVIKHFYGKLYFFWNFISVTIENAYKGSVIQKGLNVTTLPTITNDYR